MMNCDELWMQAIDKLSAKELRSLVPDELENQLDRCLSITEAHELAIWIHEPDSKSLVIGYITLPEADSMEGALSQPLTEGLVSKAFIENTTVHEEGFFRPREHSKKVDEKLSQITQHQVAVPFSVSGSLKGVVSFVQVSDKDHVAPKKWGFDAKDRFIMESVSELIGDYLELSWRRRHSE